jgi:pyruvate-formate lyase-activating enzyme
MDNLYFSIATALSQVESESTLIRSPHGVELIMERECVVDDEDECNAIMSSHQSVLDELQCRLEQFQQLQQEEEVEEEEKEEEKEKRRKRRKKNRRRKKRGERGGGGRGGE